LNEEELQKLHEAARLRDFAQEMRKALGVKEQELADLRKSVKEFTADLQVVCPHETVYEVPL